MGSQVVALAIVGNKGTHLNVLPHHFLRTHLAVQLTETVRHTVIGYFGGIGDIGKDSVVDVAVDGFQNGLRQLLAQSFALLIDVTIGATTEVDTLERAGGKFLCRHNLFQSALTILTDDECLARLQFADVVGSKVEGGLQYGTFAGQSHNLVVAIVERRTDAPGVAYGEHLARACQSAHHVAAVVVLHRGAQHVGHLDMGVNIVRNIGTFQSLFLSLDKQTLHLAVQTVSHQFQRDV